MRTKQITAPLAHAVALYIRLRHAEKAIDRKTDKLHAYTDRLSESDMAEYVRKTTEYDEKHP